MEAIRNKIETMSTESIKIIATEMMQNHQNRDAGLVLDAMIDVLCDRIGTDATDEFIDSI